MHSRIWNIDGRSIKIKLIKFDILNYKIKTPNLNLDHLILIEQPPMS